AQSLLSEVGAGFLGAEKTPLGFGQRPQSMEVLHNGEGCESLQGDLLRIPARQASSPLADGAVETPSMHQDQLEPGVFLSPSDALLRLQTPVSVRARPSLPARSVSSAPSLQRVPMRTAKSLLLEADPGCRVEEKSFPLTRPWSPEILQNGDRHENLLGDSRRTDSKQMSSTLAIAAVETPSAYLNQVFRFGKSVTEECSRKEILGPPWREPLGTDQRWERMTLLAPEQEEALMPPRLEAAGDAGSGVCYRKQAPVFSWQRRCPLAPVRPCGPGRSCPMRAEATPCRETCSGCRQDGRAQLLRELQGKPLLCIQIR
ncbi:hypothetical protein lerEdw1_015806, partial [Lerista edwardsae]